MIVMGHARDIAKFKADAAANGMTEEQWFNQLLKVTKNAELPDMRKDRANDLRTR